MGRVCPVPGVRDVRRLVLACCCVVEGSVLGLSGPRFRGLDAGCWALAVDGSWPFDCSVGGMLLSACSGAGSVSAASEFGLGGSYVEDWVLVENRGALSGMGAEALDGICGL